MTKSAARILKADDIKLDGRFQLNISQSEPPPLKDESKPFVAPQARIIDKQAEFAVIEITCSCGIKTHLRCEYAAEPIPENKPA